MSGFFDVQCPQCSKRFGWRGSYSNRPSCPRCGHQESEAALAKVEAEMQAHRDRLATDPRVASGEVRRQQRIDAGLTLRQAAGLLHMPVMQLSDFEAGRREPTAEQAALMRVVYGLDPEELAL